MKTPCQHYGNSHYDDNCPMAVLFYNWNPQIGAGGLHIEMIPIGTPFSIPIKKSPIIITISHYILFQYDDVIMSAMASQIAGVSVVCSTVSLGAGQRKIKAPRHWPLWGDSPVIGEFPAQKASNAENISIWWRHYAKVGYRARCSHESQWLDNVGRVAGH